MSISSPPPCRLPPEYFSTDIAYLAELHPWSSVCRRPKARLWGTPHIWSNPSELGRETISKLVELLRGAPSDCIILPIHLVPACSADLRTTDVEMVSAVLGVVSTRFEAVLPTSCGFGQLWPGFDRRPSANFGVRSSMLAISLTKSWRVTTEFGASSANF